MTIKKFHCILLGACLLSGSAGHSVKGCLFCNRLATTALPPLTDARRLPARGELSPSRDCHKSRWYATLKLILGFPWLTPWMIYGGLAWRRRTRCFCFMPPRWPLSFSQCESLSALPNQQFALHGLTHLNNRFDLERMSWLNSERIHLATIRNRLSRADLPIIANGEDMIQIHPLRQRTIRRFRLFGGNGKPAIVFLNQLGQHAIRFLHCADSK